MTGRSSKARKVARAARRNASDTSQISDTWQWDDRKSLAARLLGEGHTIVEVARILRLNRKTIDRWLDRVEFAQEVDRLSCMVDVAGRAFRLRVAMRAIRKKIKGSQVRTRADVLNWLKYAQSETDGIKLDLTSLLESHASVADSGQAGAGQTRQDVGS